MEEAQARRAAEALFNEHKTGVHVQGVRRELRPRVDERMPTTSRTTMWRCCAPAQASRSATRSG